MVLSKERMRTGLRSALPGIALLLMVTVAGVGNAMAATTYYIAANGSDSNNGTSKTTPWLHAPGMPNCSSTCAAYKPAAGDSIIFRGGDTWHFGASSSPATGGTWDWGAQGWSGTNANPIYIGVDQTWFSGGSWSRPILNGDNPTSTSPVGSCAHQIGSSNVLVSFASTSYIVFDNFEMTGMCQNSTGGPWGHDIHLEEAGGSNNTYEHLYIHGWTALAFSCSGGGGHCFNLFAFVGSNLDGDLHLQDVVDGTDSNPGSLGVMYLGGYNISQCVFRYASQIITTRSHILRDTLFEHWYEPGDGNAHGNLYEESGSSGGTHAYYNNLFRHICSDSGSCPLGIVGIWPQPDTSTTDYFFNNVSYDNDTGGNYFDIGQNGSSQGPITLFNNTFELPSSSGNAILQCNASSTHPFTAANNHYVLEGGSAYSSPCTGGTFVTELRMNHATATSSGYTASQSFAYSPTSTSSPTVGAGTNETGNFCGALSAAAGSDSTLSDAAIACQSDTRYSCTYNSSDHTVSCPGRTIVARPGSGAWDIAAYQHDGQGPPPPKGLAALVH
jgi:hypothetical protein